MLIFSRFSGSWILRVFLTWSGRGTNTGPAYPPPGDSVPGTDPGTIISPDPTVTPVPEFPSLAFPVITIIMAGFIAYGIWKEKK
ncbi:MAG: hypothetical protein LUQ54_05685 [Methanoregula sp.]|nr:hypothetical protein [Methanoregula sp.]